MKLLVFGSLNIDHTYQLPHLVREGETLSSSTYARNEGGKGFNQAAALAKAGQKVHFAGAIGQDGLFLKEYLVNLGINVSCIPVLAVPTGHAIIQINAQGSNSIILYGGANQAITEAQIDQVLAQFEQGDYLLMQNEISLGEQILRKAHQKGMHVILNPSPISPELLTWPFELVDWLILNEIEGTDLTGQTEPEAIVSTLIEERRVPHVVLTLGEKGAVYASGAERIYQAAIPANVVDTTAAGDTFTGYFFASVLSGKSPAEALLRAAAASSLAISQQGAAKSIPWASDVILPDDVKQEVTK